MSDSQEVSVEQPTKALESTPEPPNVVDVVPETTTPDPMPSNEASTSAKEASSPARRPLTRSQTGTVPKRRNRDDSEVPDTKKRATVSRKRQKTSASAEDSPEPKDNEQQQQQHEGSPSVSSPKQSRGSREASLPSSVSSAVGAASGPTQPISANGEITFSSATSPAASEEQQNDPSRLPRSRASLPTPIPNLTKKSRGRRVPTQDSAAVTDPEKKDHRLYVCTVDGCGKCFHRGEHLKRHIRSIHTHEKPFKCTFPLCQKYFNRHDNLLQHLKVHRDPVPKEAVVEPKINIHNNHHLPHSHHNSHSQQNHASSSSTPPHRRQQHLSHQHRSSYSPMDDPESPLAPPPSSEPRTIYNAFPRTIYSGNYAASFPATTNPTTTTFGLNPNGSSMSMPMSSSSLMSSSHHHHNPIQHHHGNGIGNGVTGGNTGMTFSSNNDSINLLASMAVSSLRTEIPPSPIEQAKASSALRSSLY